MSEGKWHGWAWGQYKEDNNKSIGFFPAPTFVPPNEPHPDQLKRCEICRSISTYADGDLACSNPKASHLEPRNCLQTLYYLPASRTCSHWQWDEHGKDTDE